MRGFDNPAHENTGNEIPAATIRQVDMLVQKWARYAAHRRYLDAEDFSQEVLLGLWESYYRHGKVPCRALIPAVVRHTAIDLLTTERNNYHNGRRLRSFDWLEVSSEFALMYAPDHRDNPEQEARKQERIVRISRTLSIKEKDLLVASLRGQIARDIAAEWGCAESRISQMKSALLKKLEDIPDE